MATYGIPGQDYGGVPGGFNITYANSKPAWSTPTTTGMAGYGGGYGGGGTAPNIATGTATSNLAATPYNVQLADIINATNRAAQQAANAGRLGPQGAQVQSNLLGNLEKQSAGLLDPQTEQMLQSGIAAGGAASGMGVDSANLAAAYRRALGLTIEGTEAGAAKQYLDLLAGNPGAPIYSMGNLMVDPGTYAGAASADAARAQAERLAAQELAYKYAALNRVGGGGGGGGGYGSTPRSSTGGVTYPTSPWVYATGGGPNYEAPSSAPWSTQDWLSSLGNYEPYQAPSDNTSPYYDPWAGAGYMGDTDGTPTDYNAITDYSQYGG